MSSLPDMTIVVATAASAIRDEGPRNRAARRYGVHGAAATSDLGDLGRVTTTSQPRRLRPRQRRHLAASWRGATGTRHPAPVPVLRITTIITNCDGEFNAGLRIKPEHAVPLASARQHPENREFEPAPETALGEHRAQPAAGRAACPSLLPPR